MKKRTKDIDIDHFTLLPKGSPKLRKHKKEMHLQGMSGLRNG